MERLETRKSLGKWGWELLNSFPKTWHGVRIGDGSPLLLLAVCFLGKNGTPGNAPRKNSGSIDWHGGILGRADRKGVAIKVRPWAAAVPLLVNANGALWATLREASCKPADRFVNDITILLVLPQPIIRYRLRFIYAFQSKSLSCPRATAAQVLRYLSVCLFGIVSFRKKNVQLQCLAPAAVSPLAEPLWGPRPSSESSWNRSLCVSYPFL